MFSSLMCQLTQPVSISKHMPLRSIWPSCLSCDGITSTLQRLVICKYTQQICQVSTGRIRGQTGLKARPQILSIDQVIVHPSWMEILLRDLFWLTIAIPSFSLSEEVAGSYRTKHLLCEAFNYYY